MKDPWEALIEEEDRQEKARQALFRMGMPACCRPGRNTTIETLTVPIEEIQPVYSSPRGPNLFRTLIEKRNRQE
jgi:hypothetical protein